MNFYKHHLGDYDGATAHLTWDEDMAYTRLLRAYYRTERPIPCDQAYRLSRASSKAQRAAVDSVLREFFTQQGDCWHNKRADEEIAAYQAQAETNRRIANTRKGQRTVHESSHEPNNEPSTNRTPNHKPDTRTKNQEPETSKSNTLSGIARRISWEFLAGVIDGEANVRLNRYEQNGSFTITPRISIYNTNLGLLESIRNDLGIGSIYTRERSEANAKNLHEINFTRDEISKIVEQCSAHVVAKKEQFLMLAEFLVYWPHDKARCEALYERTKHLNVRGKPDASALKLEKLNGYRAQAREILIFLNEKTGKAFEPVDANLELVIARLKEATPDDIRAVVAMKCREWGADEKMMRCLRPKTLFSRTNFAQYKGELKP